MPRSPCGGGRSPVPAGLSRAPPAAPPWTLWVPTPKKGRQGGFRHHHQKPDFSRGHHLPLCKQGHRGSRGQSCRGRRGAHARAGRGQTTSRSQSQTRVRVKPCREPLTRDTVPLPGLASAHPSRPSEMLSLGCRPRGRPRQKGWWLWQREWSGQRSCGRDRRRPMARGTRGRSSAQSQGGVGCRSQHGGREGSQIRYRMPR